MKKKSTKRPREVDDQVVSIRQSRASRRNSDIVVYEGPSDEGEGEGPSDHGEVEVAMGEGEVAVAGDEGNDVGKPSKMKVMCRPSGLAALVKHFKEMLDDGGRQYINAIEEIGFGGLLSLYVTNTPQALIPWLVKAFSVDSFMFKASITKEFVLGPDDVFDVFCLPRGPDVVEVLPTGNKLVSSQHPLKMKWRQEFGISGNNKGIPLGQVLEKIKSKEVADDEFKRLFALFAMSSFLTPTSNYQVDMKLLQAVDDVSKIGKMDWCSYVFDMLISGISSHLKGVGNCGGCSMFLMLVYFHRMEFRGVKLSTDLPLIQHWDDTKLTKRVEMEYKTGGLGSGILVENVYPVCKNRASLDSVVDGCGPRQSEGAHSGAGSRTDPHPSKRFIMVELPEGVESDEEIHARATDEIHEVFLLMKRDTDVITLRYLERLRAIRAQAASAPSLPTGKGKSPITLSPTQAFFYDPVWLASIDDLIEKMKAVKTAADGMAAFEASMQVPAEKGECDVGVGVSGVEEQEDASDEYVTGLEQLDSVVVGTCSNILNESAGVAPMESDDVSVVVVDAGCVEKARDGDGDGNVVVRRQLAPIIAPPTGSWFSLQGYGHDGLGCSLDCGTIADSHDLLMSDVMMSNRELFASMSSLRKNVADYCLVDDLFLITNERRNERLVSFGYLHFLPREDLQLMRPDTMITTRMIECWSLLLNNLEHQEKKHPSRFFFGVNHMAPLLRLKDLSQGCTPCLELIATWDLWCSMNHQPVNLNADLIFIPLLEDGHFFCVCINFNSRRLEFLDNSMYEDWANNKRTLLARDVCVCMGDYLEKQSAGRSTINISEFEIVNVEFGWQSFEDNLDCGIFMMLHMLFYIGEVFECGLSCPENRVLYRAELCASLVLSDMNEVRADVLANVEKFVADKPARWQALQKKREEAAKEKNHSLNKKTNDGESLGAAMPSPTSAGRKCRMSLISSESSLKSEKMGESDGVGCTLDCTVKSDNTELLSRFMRANKTLFANMLPLRKEVLDYCFLNDHTLDTGEFLVNYSENIWCVREELQTILPAADMDIRVAECWSLLLNSIEFEEKAKPSRLFFGLRHMDPLLNLVEGDCDTDDVDVQTGRLMDFWTVFFNENSTDVDFNADLVFVPLVYEKHYFAVCLNYMARKVEVLDHTVHKDWQTTVFYKLVKTVAGIVEDFLEMKGRCVDGTQSFFDISNIVNVPFEWQSNDLLNEESGCFMMMHLLFYEGKVFTCDLGRKVCRRIFCSEIAASLMLADINDYRTVMLSKMTQFIQTKKTVFPVLKIKRKVEELEQKHAAKCPEKKQEDERRSKLPLEVLDVQPITSEIPVARNRAAVRTRGGCSPRVRGRGKRRA